MTARELRYTVVIPTVLRPSLDVLLRALAGTDGPQPSEIIVVVDLPDRTGSQVSGGAGSVDSGGPPVRWLSSGGHGPAAARNRGWLASHDPWVAFLDDDVVVSRDWARRLAEDLAGLGPEAAASYARIEVPAPIGRRPTDDERRTLALRNAQFITADAAVRRSALMAVGGFDERFPHAYREDADLALRLMSAGFTLHTGSRVTTHPIGRARALASLRAQAGNADNALMRRRHGPDWRRTAGESGGRLGRHMFTTFCAGLAAAAAVSGRRRVAATASAAWLASTVRFALARVAPGPRTVREVLEMSVSSILVPPAAVAHRIRGEIAVSRAGTAIRSPVLAVLFDRDDTIIHDVPYLSDFRKVEPVPGAAEVLSRLRATGVLVGVVSNQSGVAHGRITVGELREVNDEVERRLGPFDTWQICVHSGRAGCACRKPMPGLIFRAAADLGVPVERCVVIGDTEADVEAARTAGAVGILVPTARTLPAEVHRAHSHGRLAPDLATAVALVGLGRGRTADS